MASHERNALNRKKRRRRRKSYFWQRTAALAVIVSVFSLAGYAWNMLSAIAFPQLPHIFKSTSENTPDYILQKPKSNTASKQTDTAKQADTAKQTDTVKPKGTPKQADGGRPWNLQLINSSNALPEDFTVQTAVIVKGKEVDKRIYKALNDMLNAGKNEGLDFVICSAYRTAAYQQMLFDRQVDSYTSQGMSLDKAKAKTAAEIALPGTSEHNMGLAVDIVAAAYQQLDDEQAQTPEQQWLMEHCAEYGFILRYPVDKSHITGIIFEPWHYRYVGVQAATEIMAKGICLEEYLSGDIQMA